MSNNDFGMRTFCFFFGATIGATTALLVAPQSGHRTRRKIRRKVDEKRDLLKATGENIADKSREILGRSKVLVSG